MNRAIIALLPTLMSVVMAFGDEASDYLATGIAKQAKGDTNGAIADYDQAIKLRPDYAEAYFNRGAAKARVAIAAGAEVARNDLGYSASVAKGDFRGVIADFTTAIQFKPDYAEAYFNRGLVKQRMATGSEPEGSFDAAIEDYDAAIRYKPDYAEAFVNRGLSKKFKSSPTAAIVDYNQAIRLRPSYAEAYTWRGDVKKFDLDDDCGAIADYTTAIKLASEAIKLKSGSAEAYKIRGDARKCCAHYLNDAVGDYDKAIKINPQYTDAYIGRAQANSMKELFVLPRTNSNVRNIAAVAEKVAAARRACPNYPAVADLYR